MKRFLTFAAVFFAAGALAVSCNKDPMTLDGSEWSVVSFEDLFDGSAVFSSGISGTVVAEDYDGSLYLGVSIPGFGSDGFEYYSPEEYSIVKYTDRELVFDFWYYEVDVARGECDLYDNFMGKKIYTYGYISDGTQKYGYVYFKPSGTAIDLGIDNDDSGNYYYYDKTRIYCRR